MVLIAKRSPRSGNDKAHKSQSFPYSFVYYISFISFKAWSHSAEDAASRSSSATSPSSIVIPNRSYVLDEPPPDDILELNEDQMRELVVSKAASTIGQSPLSPKYRQS